jgi:hypothetical protein
MESFPWALIQGTVSIWRYVVLPSLRLYPEKGVASTRWNQAWQENAQENHKHILTENDSLNVMDLWPSQRWLWRVYIFSDITPCSPAKVSRRFRGTYRLHLLGLTASQARKKRKAACFPRTTRRYVPEDWSLMLSWRLFWTVNNS